MTTRSIADPLAESYITVVHRLLDELTKSVEQTARIAELEAEIARRDAYQSVVTSVVNEAFAAEALDAEAAAFDLPAFPAPFPNRFPVWDEWSDVPDGVTYEGVGEQYGAVVQYVNRNGRRYFADDPDDPSGNTDNEMSAIAPFVEVK